VAHAHTGVRTWITLVTPWCEFHHLAPSYLKERYNTGAFGLARRIDPSPSLCMCSVSQLFLCKIDMDRNASYVTVAVFTSTIDPFTQGHLISSPLQSFMSWWQRAVCSEGRPNTNGSNDVDFISWGPKDWAWPSPHETDMNNITCGWWT